MLIRDLLSRQPWRICNHADNNPSHSQGRSYCRSQLEDLGRICRQTLCREARRAVAYPDPGSRAVRGGTVEGIASELMRLPGRIGGDVRPVTI